MIGESHEGLLVFWIKGWFVCKSWSKLHPDTALRSRSASYLQEVKMLVPCWKRWRRGRSFTSSLTALTRHQLMFSSRWITIKQTNIYCAEVMALRVQFITWHLKCSVWIVSVLFWCFCIAFGLIFTMCKISQILSPSEILCSFPNPSRAHFWARHTHLEPKAAQKINWKHYANMSKLWHILTRILLNANHANNIKWGNSENGWNV